MHFRHCLFCPRELSDREKREHILLNSLGGKATTRTVNCTSCNEIFGRGIDDELSTGVAVIRNYLELPSGDGKPPPTLSINDPTHGPIHLLPGGRPQKKLLDFNVDSAGDEVRINLSAGRLDQLREAIRHAAKKLKLDERVVLQIIMEDGVIDSSIFLDQPLHPISLGSDGSCRSMAKMLLVLLGSRVGSDLVRKFAISKSSAYVLTGGYRENVCLGFQAQALPIRANLEQAFGSFFNALVVRISASGRVYGYFCLYNGPAWVFSLAESASVSPATYCLFNDPQNPKIWSIDDMEASGIPDLFFLEPDSAGIKQVVGDFLFRMTRTHGRAARARAASQIFDEEATRLGLLPDQALSSNQLDGLVSSVSARLVAHHFRIPTSDRFKPDWVAEVEPEEQSNNMPIQPPSR